MKEEEEEGKPPPTTHKTQKQEEEKKKKTFPGEASLSHLNSGQQHCQEAHLIRQLACPSYLVNDLRLLDKVLAASFSGIRNKILIEN